MSGTTFICGFAYQQGNGAPATSRPLFSTTGVTIGIDPNRHLHIRDSGGSVVATGATFLNINQWYYVEYKTKFLGASGTTEVRLNGLQEIAPATANYGSVQPVQWALQSTDGFSTFSLYDDVYMLDGAGVGNNDFLGDMRVETIWPSGDGSNLQWTPNSGVTHFNRVNETTPDDDTTYNFDSTAGHRDSYTFPALSIASGNVYGMTVNLYVRKDDAATRQIASVVRQGGVNYDGAAGTPALSTTYAFYQTVYDVDPTGAGWSIATVNGDEFGIKTVT
jgi:hypothetical protein